MPTNSNQSELKFDEERINKLENKVTAIDVTTSSIKEDIGEIKVSQKENRDDISDVKDMAIRQEESQKNLKEDMEYLKQSIDKITNQMTNNSNNSLSKRIGDKLITSGIIGGIIVVVIALLKYKINLF